jgi:DNA-binding transcriptional MerR regulator/copper chaperone CopZ
MRPTTSNRRFTIGELARVAGVGVETVRFYERRGLIERPPRPASGFRAYPPEAASRLAFVREAQALGFTLREVRELLALNANPATDCAAVRGRAAAKLGQIEARMARFARMRETLRTLLARCPGRGELEKCSIVAALSSPARESRGGRHAVRSTRRPAMKTGELTIQGMHCDGCAKTIEALLSAEPGVKVATASYADGNARVVFDPAKIDLAGLAKAVERAGYQVRSSR